MLENLHPCELSVNLPIKYILNYSSFVKHTQARLQLPSSQKKLIYVGLLQFF